MTLEKGTVWLHGSLAYYYHVWMRTSPDSGRPSESARLVSLFVSGNNEG